MSQLTLDPKFVTLAVMCVGMSVSASARAADVGGPPASAQPRALVSVSLGNTTVTQSLLLLDFGLAPDQHFADATLVVRNLSSRQLTLDAFALCDTVIAKWRSPTDPVESRTTLMPEKTALLYVQQLHPAAAKKDALQRVVLFEQGNRLTTILVADVVFPQTEVVRVQTPTLESGKGKYWSQWYFVSSGPAPANYHYARHSFVTRGTAPGGGIRACGSWVDCKQIEVGDNNVSYAFSIQGYEGDLTHHASTVGAEGVLEVTYELNSSSPRLYALSTQAARAGDTD